MTYENVRYHLTTLKEVSLLTNFGGVQTPRPQIDPKFLGSWRTAALGGLLQRGGMFLVCLKRHDFVSWLGRRRNITRYFCMSHSSRSMTLRAASSIESLQTTDRPTNNHTANLSRILRQLLQNNHGTSLFVRARRVDHPKRMTPVPNRELSVLPRRMAFLVHDRLPMSNSLESLDESPRFHRPWFPRTHQDPPRTHLPTAPRRPPRRSALQ